MMGKNRRVIAAVVGVAVVAIIVGAFFLTPRPPPPPPPPAEKRIFRTTFPAPIYIDPGVGSDAASTTSMISLYDTLVHPKVTGEMEPHLAESWKASEDGLTWSFYLRRGVKFHDGKELTAEDVVFSTNRILTLGTGFAHLYKPYIEKTEAADKYAVQFKLKKKFGPFVSTLVRLFILNKDLVTKNIKTPGPYGEFGDYGKDWLVRNDAGSGPYMVKEFRVGEELVMERFKDSWVTVQPNAPDEVRFILTTEAVTVRTMIGRRELEISDPWQTVENLKVMDEMKGVDVAIYVTGVGISYMMTHNRKPPTDDVHFRRAMILAFDYDAMVTQVSPDARKPRGVIPANLPGHNKKIPEYNRDLKKAMEELKKSKYYDKLDKYEVELHWVAEVPLREKIALLFASNMAEIGIKVKVVKVPWLSIIDEMASMEKTPNLVVVSCGAAYMEVGSMLMQRFHSSSTKTWEQGEWLLNSTIDKMIEDAVETIDIESRFQKYQKIEGILEDMAVTIPLAMEPTRRAYQAYYVDWPVAKGQICPLMGYEMEIRFIQVYPEKRRELLAA